MRLLSFGNLYDEKFEDDWYGFLPLNPIRLSQAVDRLLAQDAPVSRDELYRQLGPDRFGPHGLHPSIFRAMFLFLLPDVRSLKIDLALTEDASQAEQTASGCFVPCSGNPTMCGQQARFPPSRILRSSPWFPEEV